MMLFFSLLFLHAAELASDGCVGKIPCCKSYRLALLLNFSPLRSHYMHERLTKTTTERGIPAYSVCTRLLEHARCVFKSVVLEEKHKTKQNQQQKAMVTTASVMCVLFGSTGISWDGFFDTVESGRVCFLSYKLSASK